jgi:hypothetical protein
VGDKGCAKNFDKTETGTSLVECNKPCRPTKTGADWTPGPHAPKKYWASPKTIARIPDSTDSIESGIRKNRSLMGSNVRDLQRNYGALAYFAIYKLSKDTFLPQVNMRCSFLHGGEVLGDNRSWSDKASCIRQGLLNLIMLIDLAPRPTTVTPSHSFPLW